MLRNRSIRSVGRVMLSDQWSTGWRLQIKQRAAMRENRQPCFGRVALCSWDYVLQCVGQVLS